MQIDVKLCCDSKATPSRTEHTAPKVRLENLQQVPTGSQVANSILERSNALNVLQSKAGSKGEASGDKE